MFRNKRAVKAKSIISPSSKLKKKIIDKKNKHYRYSKDSSSLSNVIELARPGLRYFTRATATHFLGGVVSQGYLTVKLNFLLKHMYK